MVVLSLVVAAVAVAGLAVVTYAHDNSGDADVERAIQWNQFLDDSRSAAPDLLDRINRFLDHADLTTSPAWVRPYAEEQQRTRMHG